MSWNEMLYAYQKEKGGVFMGSRVSDWNGELVLSCQDGPLIIRTEREGSGQYTKTSIRVRLAIRLERDYELCIDSKSAMSAGLHTVLGALDRGHEDYGCPEVTRGRTITTTDRAFTKLVLRDLELRNALLASPKDGLLILPGPGREGLHLVESWSYPGSMYTDWSDTRPDWTATEEDRARKEEKLAEQARSTFIPRLEKLVALAKTARGAALTWRMGTP